MEAGFRFNRLAEFCRQHGYNVRDLIALRAESTWQHAGEDAIRAEMERRVWTVDPSSVVPGSVLAGSIDPAITNKPLG